MSLLEVRLPKDGLFGEVFKRLIFGMIIDGHAQQHGTETYTKLLVS
jgi:hypothetical protein